MTHISVDIQIITLKLNASFMTISGIRTKQLNIFCHVICFTSDCLSFIVVEHVRFFRGALQLVTLLCVLPYSGLVRLLIFHISELSLSMISKSCIEWKLETEC